VKFPIRLGKFKNTRILAGASGLLLALTLVAAYIAPVSAVPQWPHQFWGTVYIDSVPAPEGTEVIARIANVTENFTTVVAANHTYGWSPAFKVKGDDPETPEKEGGNNGDIIDFYVAGTWATNFTFKSGSYTVLNLTVPGYNLTVNVTPSVGGNVTVNGVTPSIYPNTTTWVLGKNVTLNATAANGYIFVNWSGNLSGSTNPTNITMDSDKNVTANFWAIYNLTVISDGCCPIDVTGAVNGTVPAGGNLTFTGISEGENVTVSADDTGGCCEFVSWSDGGAQIHNITMDSDKNVTATCSVPGPFTINATAGANGNISPSGAVSVNCSANQTFNITADACYDIEDVLVDGSPVGAVPSYTFTNVTANHTINATFAIRTYTITATAGANGNISPPGAVSVNCGANQTFNITADACYDIGDVLVDGSPVGAVPNYTFTNVTANHTINATFAIKTYIINATAGANGNISPLGAVVVDCGANQTFNITADACYDIEDVLVDGSPVGAVPSYTFTNVTANHTINATFSAITYNLTVNVAPGGGGNVTVNGVTPPSYPNTTTWNCGENVTLDATAASGYSFVNWSGNLSGSTNPTNITMTGNYSIMANFAEVTATLEGNVTFPGRGGPPDSKWIEDFVVRFFQGGSEVRTDNVTTNSSGYFNITGIDPGTYNISIKNWTCLSELEVGVALTAGNTTVVDFGMTREGDSNNDDWIVLADRTILYTGWGTHEGDAGWNAHCDFNRDGWLTLADRTIMYTYWAQHGDLV